MRSRASQRDILPTAVKNRHFDTITWDKAQGGTATLGGTDNGNGILTIKGEDNIVYMTITKTGIIVNDGTNDRIIIGEW